MNNSLSYTMKSIAAGSMIAISSLCYINSSDKVLGSLLFSLGILSIMIFDFKLCTGIAYKVNNIKEFLIFIKTFLFNAIGCLFLYIPYSKDVVDNFSHRLTANNSTILLMSIICGILITIAVISYRSLAAPNNIIVCIMSITTFITIGAEHVVADICYMILARIFNLQSIIFLLLVLLGNLLGAHLFYIILSIVNMKKE